MSAAEPTPSRAAFIFAFAAIYLIWGSTYLAIRVTVQTMPPFAMAGARFLLAGALLYVFLRLRGASRLTLRQWRDNAIIGTFLLLGGNGLLAWAEQTVSSSTAALTVGVLPVFMVLTEWAWPGGRRPRAIVAFGMILGLAGVIWLNAPWSTSTPGSVQLPMFGIMLFGSLSWAIGSIYSRQIKSPAPPFLASAAQMLCGGAALALTGVIRGEFTRLNVSAFSLQSWSAFIYLVLVGSLIGFSTFVWLIKHSTPARVSTYAYVNPVVAVFLGWIMLGEQIYTRTFVGAVMIISAVVIITTQKAKKVSPANPTVLSLNPEPAQNIGRVSQKT